MSLKPILRNVAVVAVVAAMAVSAPEAKRKNHRGKALRVAPIGEVPVRVFDTSAQVIGRVNVAVDDVSIPAADREARVTVLLSNSGPETRLALCPMLSFEGAERSVQSYGFQAGDGTPDCLATTSSGPIVSLTLDSPQSAPTCPPPAPVVGDIVTVPAAANGAPGEAALVYTINLASLGAGLEGLPASDVRRALLNGGGVRFETLSALGSGISTLVCPNGVNSFLGAAPDAGVATTSNAWRQSFVPVATSVKVNTALSSAASFGAPSNTTAKAEALWRDSLATPLTGNLTLDPAVATDFTLESTAFQTGELTVTFTPDSLPEGFVGEATVITRTSASGEEIARSIHLFAKDSTPPAVTAAATTRTTDALELALTAADAALPLNAVRLVTSIGGAPSPSNLMDRESGIFEGPTTFHAELEGIAATDSVGATVTVSDDLENAAAAILPVAGAGADQTLECTSFDGAVVPLDASLSTNDPAITTTFTWSNGFGTATGQTVSPTLPLGVHDVTLTLSDTRSFTGTDHVTVAVVDTTPPVIDSITPTPACLWPPNHRFARYVLGENLQLVGSDICERNPTARIVNVTSSAPGNSGSDDIVVGPRGFCIRAERQGNEHDGRVYTVTLELADASGNATLGEGTIFVPHDMRDHPDCGRADSTSGLKEADAACSPESLGGSPSGEVSSPRARGKLLRH